MNERVEREIQKLYDDTSVDQTETWNRLQAVIEHCRELQEALDDAEQNKGVW